ncbi:MAG: GntR family transcriptional regulator [Phycisphaerae bacterium]|nr:GntR family transcriptional regulator [Phycisphaerae bacterium]
MAYMSNQTINLSNSKKPLTSCKQANILLDRSSSTPISAQLAHRLRQMIRDEFEDGQRFYTEQDLSSNLDVSRSTIQRIMRDLTHEGLLTRRAGRGSFVRKVKRNVGKLVLFLPNVKGGFSAHVMQAASIYASQQEWSYHHVFTDFQTNLSEEVSRIGSDDRVLLVSQPKILLGQLLDLLEAKDTPTVAVDLFLPGRPQLAVSVDNVAGMKLAVKKLVSMGHKRILLFNAEPDLFETVSIRSRLEGFCQAAAEYGVDLCGEGIVDAHTEPYGNPFERACQHAGQVFDLSPAPTAVVCTSDPAAWGLLHEAANRGVAVPEQMSVVAFGDDYPSSFQNPPLTVVAQPVDDMIKVAIERLQKMTGFSHEFEYITLLPKWIERESTAKPKMTEKLTHIIP